MGSLRSLFLSTCLTADGSSGHRLGRGAEPKTPFLGVVKPASLSVCGALVSDPSTTKEVKESELGVVTKTTMKRERKHEGARRRWGGGAQRSPRLPNL